MFTVSTLPVSLAYTSNERSPPASPSMCIAFETEPILSAISVTFPNASISVLAVELTAEILFPALMLSAPSTILMAKSSRTTLPEVAVKVIAPLPLVTSISAELLAPAETIILPVVAVRLILLLLVKLSCPLMLSTAKPSAST